MSDPVLDLAPNASGESDYADASTGQRYSVNVADTTLTLRRLYHDDSPVVGAPFELELENGQVIKGVLDDNGGARIVNLPALPKRIRYGADRRDYTRADQTPNPEYLESFTSADADATVTQAQTGPRPDGALPPEARQSFALEAVGWVWGTLEGGFNEKQTGSQILVDAVIGMIPLVGDVTAVRDLLAVVIRLADDPKKRDEIGEWVMLVLMLLALIPVLGGVLKGVGKLLVRAGEDAAKESVKIGDLIAFLNRVGIGDARQWIKDLDFEKYSGPLKGRWSGLMKRLDSVADATLKRLGKVMPAGMRNRLNDLKSGFDALAKKGEEMIPDALKEINSKLHAVRDKVYQGDWIPVPKGRAAESETREAEARLVDVPDEAKLAEDMPFPQNGLSAYHHQDGWPDLRDYTEGEKGESKIYWAINAFSGPIKPVKLSKGTEICRVIQDGKPLNGLWWTHHLPSSGEEWRLDLAVLNRFSSNGYYEVFVVPEDTELLVWEGKAASQIDNAPLLRDGSKNPDFRQKLPGGGTQLFIDFKKQTNNIVQEEVLKCRLEPTKWKDYMGVNILKSHSETQNLELLEFAPK